MIKIFNSLSKKKENLEPIKDGHIKMYACGITPYDEAHIGHAMQAVIYDIIRRYLEYKGFKVDYIRNFTDIDDKIIDRANIQGINPLELSRFYIDDSKKDLSDLKVRPASHEPLVSEHIDHIIDFIKGLEQKEIAYVSNGSVYFDVAKFKEYGKLSRRSRDEMTSEDENSDKRSSYDFVLWKASKPGEPEWDSPWGKGRPGWHIECSVLAKTYLGDSIDIHGGGIDIVFPHHENEIAQSESLTGKPFAKYWLHNGLLMVGKQKMSKSLGNFFTIKEALKLYGADVIRYMIISFSYNSNINFEEANLINAEKRIYYYYQTLSRISEILSDDSIKEGEDEFLTNAYKAFNEKFENSMNDNFNTAQTLATLNELFTTINQRISKKKNIKKDSIKQVSEVLAPVRDLMSILDEDPLKYIDEYKTRVSKRIGLGRDYIENMINERNEARKNKDFAKSDEIRDKLLKNGISIMDTVDGTDWNYDPK